MPVLHKLALFHPTFDTFGGAEILSAAQAQSLRTRGYDVCIVTRAWDRRRWTERLEGIEMRLVRSRPLMDALSWGPLGSLEREAKRAARFLGDRDVVMAMNFPCNAELGAMELRARRVWYCNEPNRERYVIEANPHLFARIQSNGEPKLEAEKEFVRELEKHRILLARKARRFYERQFDISATKKLDRIIAISEFTAENVRTIYGVNPTRVVYPIVRFPERGRNRSGLDRSRLGVLVHSRLEAPKNVDVVIRGFSLFHRHRRDAHLHVVGEGATMARLLSLVAELGLSSVTTFHGFASDTKLAHIYDACDVFALLPVDEPFGLVFPEAAAHGLLLIGPNHGGPLEIMDGGRLGWALDPFSPEAVADALSNISALSDAEVDRRREEADTACRSRFSEATIGPELARALA